MNNPFVCFSLRNNATEKILVGRVVQLCCLAQSSYTLNYKLYFQWYFLLDSVL